MSAGNFDFGYPWWISYGHLLAVAACGLAIVAVRVLRGPKWVAACAVVIGLWAIAGFLVMQTALNLRVPAEMPTPRFLSSGTGRVLDLGAGTGRSSIMVLRARPNATLVALDLFGDSFRAHFGDGDGPRALLARNLHAAGVESRATVVAADMRRLPFEAASFDAVTSSYAIDHLRRDDVAATLAESARVLRPGGELLTVVVSNDAWLKFAFGPLLLHSRTRDGAWWTARIAEAGFRVVERGTRPGTIWVYATR